MLVYCVIICGDGVYSGVMPSRIQGNGVISKSSGILTALPHNRGEYNDNDDDEIEMNRHTRPKKKKKKKKDWSLGTRFMGSIISVHPNKKEKPGIQDDSVPWITNRGSFMSE